MSLGMHPFRRWIAALLVLVAAVHATLPEGRALERAPGSAFSATTSDVAIGCGRVEVGQRTVPERPAPPPPTCLTVVTAGAAPALVFVDLPRGWQARAPPADPTVLTPLNPRAPPAA